MRARRRNLRGERATQTNRELVELGNELPKRLTYPRDVGKSVCDPRVPTVAERIEVVRVDNTPANVRTASTQHGSLKVQRHVVVGELFTGRNVCNRQLKIETGVDAVGRATVIHVAGKVPTKQVIAIPESVGVMLKTLRRQRVVMVWVDFRVERVAHPCERAAGYRLGGKHSEANLWIDEPKLSAGVKHWGWCQRFAALVPIGRSDPSKPATEYFDIPAISALPVSENRAP